MSNRMDYVRIEKSGDQHAFQSFWITDLLHSFPHLNFQFDKVNSTFDPQAKQYQQAIILWAGLPLAVCVLFLLVFFVYFIVRCCQKLDTSKTSGSACCKIFTGFMIFLTMCLAGVSFYENQVAHQGVEKLRNAALDINSTVESSTTKIHGLEFLASDVSKRLSHKLEQILSQVPNVPDRQELLNQVTMLQQRTKEAQMLLDDINIHYTTDGFDDFINISGDVEYYRWLGTIVVLCLFLFIFLVAFIGLVIRSHSVLICSATVTIICSIFIWATYGVYLGSSVALGDLCKNPDAFVLRLVKDPKEKVTLRAYVKCSDTNMPYSHDIVKAREAVAKATEILLTAEQKAQGYSLPGLDAVVSEIKLDFDYSTGNLTSLLHDVGRCDHVHKIYVRGLNGVCETTFIAVTFLALLILIIALNCVIIVFSSSVVWRLYRKRRVRQEYEVVDDSDPFLPRLPPYDNDYGTMRFSSPTPWSERGTLQASPSAPAPDDEGLMMLPSHHHAFPADDSPPPAYTPGRFAQHYAETGTSIR